MNDDYLHTPTDELAADPRVQAYVLEGRDAAAWTAWLAEHPAAATRVAEARALLRQLDAELAPVADEAQVARVWSRIAASTSTDAGAEARVVSLGRPRDARRRDAPRRPGRRRLAWVLAAAAAVAALLLLLPGTGPEVYESGAGEAVAVELPDGSRVALAPGSRLEVESYDGARALHLTGEAFFEVAPGAPFTVATAHGRVRVLGTSFSVADDGELAVACATGRVRVTAAAAANGAAAVELTPGWAVRTRGGELAEATAVATDEVAAWRRGRLYFRGAPVHEVAARLRRHFGRTFATPPDLRDAPVTIDVPSDDFPEAIARLGFVLQVPLDTAAASAR